MCIVNFCPHLLVLFDTDHFLCALYLTGIVRRLSSDKILDMSPKSTGFFIKRGNLLDHYKKFVRI